MTTNPGRHPNFEIEKYTSEVRRAIRRIELDFYVTRSFNPISVGNSTYQAILVRPTDDTSMYLNTDRELLVVFSDYETFEIRTLEAYDIFYDLLENMRVDYSIRFLVSGDNNIQKSIAQYVQQNPEYPIIVPVTFHSLFSATNPLVDAVRENYVIRDLFGYQSPLRQEHFFFGRNDSVNTVLDLAKSGQHSSLFGLRKSGKTSTIFAIQRRSKAMDVLTIVIDCQAPAVHARRYDELLNKVLNDTRKLCGLAAVKFQAGLSRVEVAEKFSSDMKSILGRAKGQVLLIFDEIEQISPLTAASEHWRNDADPILFWQIIRSFCQTDGGGRVVICLVGTSPYLLETSKINGLDNPVYLFAQKRFIPNLSSDDVELMIRRLGFFMGLNFSAQLIGKIYNAFGEHPFFTRQVCSKIHQLAANRRPQDVSLNLLQLAESDFSSDLNGYLKDIIENLRAQYPEEYDLLAEVVRGDKSEFAEIADEVPDLVDHLTGYGLIARRGDDYDITLDAIRNVVSKIDGEILGQSDRWSSVNSRRNLLEQNIRTYLNVWSRPFSATDWQGILEKALTGVRREKLVSSVPNVLFARTKSPLYLSDLMGFLKLPVVLPHIDQRRSEIITNIDLVNKSRNDAHANDFSDSEFERVSRALDMLEGEFCDL